MLSTNKKLSLLALGTAVAVLLISGVVYAQWRGDYGPSNGFSWGQWNQTLPGRLSLDQDQLNRAQEIMFDCQEKMLPLQRKLQRLELVAQGYDDSPDAQPDSSRSYWSQVHDIRSQIADFRRQSNAKINDLLSNAQRSYFGNDFDWCDLPYDAHMMNHDRYMDNGCWAGYYQRHGRQESTYDHGCCWR